MCPWHGVATHSKPRGSLAPFAGPDPYPNPDIFVSFNVDLGELFDIFQREHGGEKLVV